MRIGVNGGSLNQELVLAKMQENTDKGLGRTSEEIINECMVLSAVQSTELAIESGLRRDQIIISCKTSRPRDLIAVYRILAQDRSTAAPGLRRWNGHQGWLVGRRHGCAAERGDRRHDPRIAHSKRVTGAKRYTRARLLQSSAAIFSSVTAARVAGREQQFQELAERTRTTSRSMPDGEAV